MSRHRWWPAVALLAAGCGGRGVLHEITVAGSDYAFSVPDTLPAGPALIHYLHDGAVAHEMILGRLRAGASPAEFADSLAHDRSVRRLLDGGTAVLFGAPGQSDNPISVGVTLASGRHYAVWCQFSDEPGKPKHMMLGMFKLLVVR